MLDTTVGANLDIEANRTAQWLCLEGARALMQGQW